MLWANLVTLIGTCKHLERRTNIPAGVSLYSLYSQFSRHAPLESRNASTRLCFLTFSSVPAGHVQWSKREGDKSSFISIDGTGFFSSYLMNHSRPIGKQNEIFQSLLSLFVYMWNAVLIGAWTLLRVHGKENVLV